MSRGYDWKRQTNHNDPRHRIHLCKVCRAEREMFLIFVEDGMTPDQAFRTVQAYVETVLTTLTLNRAMRRKT